MCTREINAHVAKTRNAKMAGGPCRLFVVGIGPGHAAGMTAAAHAALDRAELICGYNAYIELVRPLLPHKRYLKTGMREEIERCQMAIEAAREQDVALVCSGDAGVYGLASLVYELAGENPPFNIEIVPGVTAALSGASLLGVPLSGDFAVISLSDLLIPWDVIERRLRGALAGDFVIALYNPGSSQRTGHLSRACDILLAERAGSTPCGLAKNIGRVGEETRLLTLSDLRETAVDMFTTVFVGNSTTRVIGGKLVTPRGYEVIV